MSLILVNQTSNQLSYISGKVIVPASGNVTVSFGLAPYLALDATFISDLLSAPSNVVVSDGINFYYGKDGKDYIDKWLVSGPPQNSNDPITFTLAGMGFSVAGSASLSNSSETAVLLLTNPANSGVNARAMFFYAAPNSTQGIATIKIYTNPTVTNNGNALSIQNNLVDASSPSSLMQCYSGPTVSNNGNFRIGIVSNANSDASLFNFAQTAILAPGNSILLTVTLGNLGLLASATTYFFMQWVEV